VKDFHFQPAHQGIDPLVLSIGGPKYLSLKISTRSIPETIGFVEEKWKQFAPGRPFDYFFLDENFDKIYRTELRTMKLFALSSILAILIACLGLFGLISFMAEQRTKEIGIRKVLGASIPEIVILLSREFTKWIIIAIIIAWPVGLYIMQKWLQNYAYRINLGIWIFILSGIATLTIALLTVGYQAFKAARANPVEALKYE